MHRLGNKNEARKLAQKASVPVVPGSEGLIENEEEALAVGREAWAFRYSSRRRPAAADAACAWPATNRRSRAGLKSARQEAETAFKDGSVYLEKYIEQPRHVEVQLLGDRARQHCPLMGARLFVAAPPSETRRRIAGPELAG